MTERSADGTPTILVVGILARNVELLQQFLEKQGYNSRGARSVEELDVVIEDGTVDIHLALIDISGFDRTIWGYCERLSARGLPLLVISPQKSDAVQRESAASGARGVLVKPLIMPELARTIRSLMPLDNGNPPDHG